MKRNEMKPKDTKPERRRTLYWYIAIICLIYGGVSLIIFVQQMYSFYLREQVQPLNELVDHNRTQFNQTTEFMFRSRVRDTMVIPLATTFFGSLISIISGVCLLTLLRKKEKKELKEDILDSIILPDEKLVMRELEKHNGELTQSELVKSTELSKVKVHRIVKRLESRGIVRKLPYGLTNKIKLEKKYME